jgi:hypothetical protein
LGTSILALKPILRLRPFPITVVEVSAALPFVIPTGA